MKKLKKVLLKSIIGLAALYLVLLIPDSADNNIHLPSDKKPFAWNRDALWQQMEENFRHAKQMPRAKRDSMKRYWYDKILEANEQFSTSAISNDTHKLNIFQSVFFNAAPFVAAADDSADWYFEIGNELRSIIKGHAQSWNVKDTAVKNSLYKLLYGTRAASEEVMLQKGINTSADPNNLIYVEQSITPYNYSFNMRLHSGDILVSRGGAEVSALISRGNDYPGNFSHVALIYVEEKTNKPYLIEAHIERGVAISTLDEYLADKKLRIMVLRLRQDLPLMQQDSMLPHKAAKAAYTAAIRRHIPYDFKMNFYDTAAMFCSEVASYAYKTQGVELWQNSSTISSPGVVNWLHDFGVENFVTQMPSDLEYDQQLSIVAEWRDAATLYKDHIDNAAMDALLEKANQGQSISYNHWLLPIVRVIKGWCWIKNQFGKEAMIPEGMSATRALKNQTFVDMHKNLRNQVQQQADAFSKQNGYRPPYWQLVKIAEAAAK